MNAIGPSRLASATKPHRVPAKVPLRVLILIPTLNVGGAEMDLVRILPRIDRAQFKVTVCTFLSRGELADDLERAGITVMGPLSPSLYNLRASIRRIFRGIAPYFNRTPLAAIAGIARLIQRSARRGFAPFLKIFAFHGKILARLWGIRRVFSFKGLTILFDSMRLARPIRNCIRDEDIQIVHTVLPNAYLVGACACTWVRRRPRLVMSRVSLNRYQLKYPLLGFIERHILHTRIDQAVVNSKAILAELEQEGVSASKTSIIHNGIDARAFQAEMMDRAAARRLLGIDDATVVFGVVANLHLYKGHEDLLLALAALSHRTDVPWLCLVVGEDRDRRLSGLLRLCGDYGIAKNVRFLGLRTALGQILPACDIHVSASHEEGLPNNIIEAMCARLPVVATAVGGVPELVAHGETGLLVPPREASQLADALLKLAISPALRKQLGDAGYRKALTDFDLRQTVDRFEALYRNMAAEAPVAGAICGPRVDALTRTDNSRFLTVAEKVLGPHRSRPQEAHFEVAILFYNRAVQTLECAESFLGQRVAPDIIILDQGSSSAQRKFLDSALARYPNVRFVTLDKNIGVSAGRNRLCRECSADWILFVDNDAVLTTDDGCASINDALVSAADTDGFSPQIFNVHENRFVRRTKLVRRGSETIVDTVAPDAVRTNMFSGGAALLRRSLLLDSSFDERLFVGFEDHELAHRALAAGQELQIALLDNVVFVHKHMPVIAPEDVATTQARYDNAVISRSAEVVSTTHGPFVLADWPSWTADQRREMLAVPTIVHAPAKPVRVTFVISANNRRLTDSIQEFVGTASDSYIASLVCFGTDDPPGHILQNVVRSEAHILHFFSPRDFLRLVSRSALQECAELAALPANEILERFCKSRITLSVHEDLIWDQEVLHRLRPLFWFCDRYWVDGQKQVELFRSLSDYPKPSALIPEAFDLSQPAESGIGVDQRQSRDDHWDRDNRAPLWSSLFAEVIRNTHPQQAGWRRVLIEKFYLQ